MTEKSTSGIVKKAEDIQEVELTESQALAIKEMANFWVQCKAAGNLGGKLGGILKWFVLFIAAWTAFKAGLFEWLKDGLK